MPLPSSRPVLGAGDKLETRTEKREATDTEKNVMGEGRWLGSVANVGRNKDLW